MIAQRDFRATLVALALAALWALSSGTPVQAAATLPGTTNNPIIVEMNEGRLVRLSSAANSVFIANPGIADVAIKSPRLVYIFGTKPGETTLYAVDRNDRIIASMEVRVNHNLSRLNGALSQLVPDGNVTATSLDGTIVLSGSVIDAVDAENARRLADRFLGEEEEMINQIEVISSNQVNLRVQISEVDRSVVKQFGFNWENSFENGSYGIVTGTGGTDIAGTVVIDPFTGLPGGAFLTNPVVDSVLGFGTFGVLGGTLGITGLLEALAADNLVTILAEPNLTALSGETASFLAGGEFPIPVLEEDAIVIIFKEFGVSLSFTPTVLSGNRISMRLRPEVSELTTQGGVTIGGFSVPGITTRRAETTVELASGQTFAIAGMFSNSSQEDLRKFPAIGELPIIGQLFSSDKWQRRETELMITVTPYLVRPTNGPMPLPTDNFVENDTPTVRVNSNLAQVPYAPQTIPLNDGSPLAQTAQGQAGFIVE